MPTFGEKSRGLLAGCDARLQDICCRAVEIMDFTIITGYRNKEDQDKAFAAGLSKLKWPAGKHNNFPSLAIDIAPYPVDFKDTSRFILLAGIMLGVAHSKGIKLRWGGDWDGNLNMKDNKFDDLGHFEIVT